MAKFISLDRFCGGSALRAFLFGNGEDWPEHYGSEHRPGKSQNVDY